MCTAHFHHKRWEKQGLTGPDRMLIIVISSVPPVPVYISQMVLVTWMNRIIMTRVFSLREQPDVMRDSLAEHSAERDNTHRKFLNSFSRAAETKPPWTWSFHPPSWMQYCFSPEEFPPSSSANRHLHDVGWWQDRAESGQRKNGPDLPGDGKYPECRYDLSTGDGLSGLWILSVARPRPAGRD